MEIRKLAFGAEGSIKEVDTATPLPVTVIADVATGTNLEVTQLLVKTAVQDLDTAMGAVTASPTANTLLARLKDILSLTVLAAGTNLIGKVGIDQTTPGTTDSVTIKASESVIGKVVGNLTQVTIEMTRTADTNAYIAGDVVSQSVSTTTPVLLQNIFRIASGSGYIVGMKLTTDKKSITPRMRVHFFNINTATLAADNAQYKELYADASKRCTYYDLPAMTTAVDTTNSDMSRAVDMSMRLPIVAAAASRDLYVAYEALDAFTPASGEKFSLTVWLDNN